MAGETTSIALSMPIELREVEELYESERNKAALIYPKLVFRQWDERSFEIGFHPKYRNWRDIDQYKHVICAAIQRRYPGCRAV